MKKEEFVTYRSDSFDATTIPEQLYASLAAYRHQCVARIFNGTIERRITYQELYNDVMRLCELFASNQKSHIAFMCDFTYEFICLFLAVTCTGNIAIPIDPHLNGGELNNKLSYADVEQIIVDSKYTRLISGSIVPPCVGKIIETNTGYSSVSSSHMSRVCGISLDPSSCAAMFFTSGTTGKNKLVMLTHENLLSNISSLCKHICFFEDDSIIPFLPNYHVLGIITGVFSALVVGGTLCISRGQGYIFEDLLHYQPTIMVIVPIIAKIIYQRIMRDVMQSVISEQLYEGTVTADCFRYVNSEVAHMLFDRCKNDLGGRIRMILCGGSSIEHSVIHFFNAIGFDFLQAYGLTECSPVVSLNQPQFNNWKSCGRVIPGVQVEIRNGIICVKGSNVFSGYYNDEVTTQNSFVEGWFVTGDIGFFDNQNYLHVVGRTDELIVLSNGENVNPIELENLIASSSAIIDSIVVFRQSCESDVLAAAITTSLQYITLNRKTVAELVQEDIIRVNNSLPTFQRIQKFYLLDEFPLKQGMGKIERSKLALYLKEGILV